MHLFRQKSTQIALGICLAFSAVLQATTEDPGPIFRRQHIQGQSEIICPTADDDDEPEACAAGYDIDDDEAFVTDEPKQEWGNYGMFAFSYHSPRGVGYSRGYYSLGFSNALMTGNDGCFTTADWRFHLMEMDGWR